MNKINMYILAEFIDEELLVDKLEYFLRKRKDFTKEEANEALNELGLD